MSTSERRKSTKCKIPEMDADCDIAAIDIIERHLHKDLLDILLKDMSTGRNILWACDDYSGYDILKKNNPNIKLQRCWAHVRRRFADIVKALDSKSKNNSIAYKILLEISKLFELEKRYKKQEKNPIQILKLRQKDMLIIIKNIENLVFNCNPLKGSALDNAISGGYITSPTISYVSTPDNPETDDDETVYTPLTKQAEAGTYNAGIKYTLANPASRNPSVTYQLKLEFDWGTAFGGENPVTYYNTLEANSTNVQEAKDALGALNNLSTGNKFKISIEANV